MHGLHTDAPNRFRRTRHRNSQARTQIGHFQFHPVLQYKHHRARSAKGPTLPFPCFPVPLLLRGHLYTVACPIPNLLRSWLQKVPAAHEADQPYPGVSVTTKTLLCISVIIQHHIPELALTCAHVCPEKTSQESLVARGLGGGGQLLEGLGDDAQTLPELRLGDDQRGSEADNVAVGRLGLQQRVVSTEHTKGKELESVLPGAPCS